jgi:hypothetical protein
MVAVLFGILGAGMEGDLRSSVPYIVVLVLCVVQFLWPTLLGWFVLTALFWAYAIAVGIKFQPPAGEYVLFLLLGALPAFALLFSWPKPVGQ